MENRKFYLQIRENIYIYINHIKYLNIIDILIQKPKGYCRVLLLLNTICKFKG